MVRRTETNSRLRLRERRQVLSYLWLEGWGQSLTCGQEGKETDDSIDSGPCHGCQLGAWSPGRIHQTSASRHGRLQRPRCYPAPILHSHCHTASSSPRSSVLERISGRFYQRRGAGTVKSFPLLHRFASGNGKVKSEVTILDLLHGFAHGKGRPGLTQKFQRQPPGRQRLERQRPLQKNVWWLTIASHKHVPHNKTRLRTQRSCCLSLESRM